MVFDQKLDPFFLKIEHDSAPFLGGAFQGKILSWVDFWLFLGGCGLGNNLLVTGLLTLSWSISAGLLELMVL